MSSASPPLSGGLGPPSPSERFSSLFWRRKHPTVVYCGVFWAFGMCVAFLGPTLKDLQCMTGASIATMGWVFFAQTLFILVGSAAGGFLSNRFTPNVVLFLATIVLACTLAIIPFCHKVALLALVLAIMGYFMGTIDTVANVCMIGLYTKDVSPFLQALHFFYGLGAFVSPIIAEPFLTDGCNNTTINVTSSTKTELEETSANASNVARVTTQSDYDEISRIDYAFWIMALLQVPVILAVFTLLAKQVYTRLTRRESASTIHQREEYEVMDKGLTGVESASAEQLSQCEDNTQATTSQALLMTLLTASLLFLYDGLQAAYGGYVYTYATDSFSSFTATKAAYLNACFWGTFAFGRLISIPIATRLSPDFMLFCNILGCGISMFMMMVVGHNRIVLYMGTCIFGLFLSSIYPTAISLTEQYVHVTPFLASCIIVGAATGEMLFPIIVGHEFDSVGPSTLMVTGVVVTLLSFFVYGAMWVTGNSILRRTATPGMLGMLTSFVQKPGPDEDSGLVTHHVKYYSRMRSDMSESSLGGEMNDTTNTELNNRAPDTHLP